MNMLRKSLLSVALLAPMLAMSTMAFDNPVYVTGRVHPIDGTADTLAILTFLNDPAYLELTEVEIAWIVRHEIKDSLRVYAKYGVCSFDLYKRSHTWYGDFSPPDTLRCRFTLTPLGIGSLGMGFRIDLGLKNWKMLWIGFDLDETGHVVENPGGLDYGCFGLAPEHMRGPLRFVGQCYDKWAGGPDELFGIVAEVDPPPGPEGWSNLVATARPTTDMEFGAYYRISYDDIFEVELEQDTDWPRHVGAGEELVIRAKVRPVRSGTGSIHVSVVGYRPKHEPTSKGGMDKGGMIGNAMNMDFAIDHDLNILAYGRHGFDPEPNPQLIRTKPQNDAYRLPAIRQLPRATEQKHLYSVSFFSRQQELYDQFKKKRHQLEGK